MKTIMILNSTVVVLGILWLIIPSLKENKTHRVATLGFAIIFTLNFYFMLRDYTLLSSLLRALGFTSFVYLVCLAAIYYEKISEKK